MDEVEKEGVPPQKHQRPYGAPPQPPLSFHSRNKNHPTQKRKIHGSREK